MKQENVKQEELMLLDYSKDFGPKHEKKATMSSQNLKQSKAKIRPPQLAPT